MRCRAEHSIVIGLPHGLSFQLQHRKFTFTQLNSTRLLFCFFYNKPLSFALHFQLSEYLKKSGYARRNWWAHISKDVRGSAWARNIQRRWSQRNSYQLHRASESHWPVSGTINQTFKSITGTQNKFDTETSNLNIVILYYDHIISLRCKCCMVVWLALRWVITNAAMMDLAWLSLCVERNFVELWIYIEDLNSNK